MKKRLLSFFSFLFIAAQLFATGNNNGSSCAHAYSYTMAQDAYLSFALNQAEYAIEFTANDSNLVALVMDTGFSNFAQIAEIEWYKKGSCNSLLLVQVDFAEPQFNLNYSSNKNVDIGDQYLMVLKRDPVQGLPAASFRYKNQRLKKTSCPLNTGLPLREMIYNGDFTYASVDMPNLRGAVVEDTVCNWRAEAISPDYIYIGPLSTNRGLNDPTKPLMNDPYVGLVQEYKVPWRTPSVNIAEAMSTGFAFPLESGDQLHLSFEMSSLKGTVQNPMK